jgi:CDP-glycerol glycerophosphotransferase (TagB/SpsB family)
MATLKFKDLKWNGESLEILLDEKEIIEKLSTAAELVLIHRESKTLIHLNFSYAAVREKNSLFIQLSDITFNTIKESKETFDLAFKDKDIIYKFVKNDNIKLEKAIRYFEPVYKLDNKTNIIPYYTTKNEIAFLVGDSREIAKTYCDTINDRISLDSFQVDNTSIICNLRNFNKDNYEEVYFVFSSENDKKQYNVEFSITLQNDIQQIMVDLDKLSFWRLNKVYDIYLETKSGYIIKRNRIGLFSTESNLLDKYYNKINYNEEIIIWPFVTDDGALSIHIVDEQLIERRNYKIIEGKTFIEDMQLNNNILDIKLIKDEEEGFELPSKIKAVIIDNKKRDSISVDLDKDNFLNNSSISIDILRILNDIKMKPKSRWKIYLKLYYKDTIILNILSKNALGIDSVKKRYMDPINMKDNLVGAVYITSVNQLALLYTDSESYKKEVNTIIEGHENISECLVSLNTLSFNLNRKINKDLLKSIELILIERKTKQKFYASFDYIINRNNTKLNIDFTDFIEKYKEFVSRWDFYIELTYDSYIERKRIGNFRSPALPNYKRYFNSFESRTDNIFVPYLTVKNELSIIIQKESTVLNEKYKHNIAIKQFNMNKNLIMTTVELEMTEIDDYKLEGAVLIFRNKHEQKDIEISSKEKNINGFKRSIQIAIDIDKCELEQIFWDVYVVVIANSERLPIKVKNPTTAIKYNLNNKVFGNSYTINNEYIVYPYITGNNSLALSYRNKGEFEEDKYKLREGAAYLIYKIFKGYFEKKDIWLVYEKFSETAQDNSFYFFKYCYYNQPEKNVYYVIKKNSPDYQNLKGMESKVLDFMSIKHLLYLCAAKILVSSESKTHGYAWRVQQGKIKQILDAKKHAFLQHGVTALKRVDYVFSKNAKTAVDLFVVTSDYERKIIKDNFGYNDDEIITTGFCRWDELIDKSKKLEQKEIFLMPTWRNWLDEVSEDKFVATPYFKNYMALLNSEKLHNLLTQNNIKLNFYLHPKFKYYIDNFHANSEFIKIIQFGEEKVNELLMKTSLLITDYSSVAWDVYYQKKPIIFYQFDIEDYNNYQGSYLDMETELFGDRVFNADELVNIIEEYIANSFNEKQIFADMRKKYFKYVDTNNSKRTLESIQSSKILKSSMRDSTKSNNKLAVYRRIREHAIVRRLWNLAKKNKKTLKFAKKMKGLVRRLTIRK